MLGRSSWNVNIYCMRAATNMATYRMQKIAGIWIADGVFREFLTFHLIVYELRMTSQAVCSESMGVNRRPDLIPTSCRHALPVSTMLLAYTVTHPCDTVPLTQAPP